MGDSDLFDRMDELNKKYRAENTEEVNEVTQGASMRLARLVSPIGVIYDSMNRDDQDKAIDFLSSIVCAIICGSSEDIDISINQIKKLSEVSIKRLEEMDKRLNKI